MCLLSASGALLLPPHTPSPPQAMCLLSAAGALTLLPAWRLSGIAGSSSYGGALAVGGFMGLCFLVKAGHSHSSVGEDGGEEEGEEERGGGEEEGRRRAGLRGAEGALR